MANVTTEIVLEAGKVGEAKSDGFRLAGGSAASVVHAFSDMKPERLRLSIDGPQKLTLQRVMTVTELEQWLDKLRTDGYTVKLSDAKGEPTTLESVSFTAEGE